ncbi:MAG: hypothetical protein CVV44_18265 [Spirochaetae bacterium HGW-Spirochaetae-1]|jgi:hypothetical protein|nr:MAG: hypothetical protein CVV44_18265 [Spirochaetae bacterium HGW-Spirochaetae-1]
MSGQYDSLNEKTRLIELALKYTNGSMDKAKAMASGQYLDNVAVKTKFFLQKSRKSGLFLAFFNIIDEYISCIESVFVNNSTIYDKVRVFDDWKVLYKDINAYRQGGDAAEVPGLNDRLIDGMVEKDIFPEVQDGNLDNLTKSMQLIVRGIFPDDQVQCQIELEPTSSLAMDLGGVLLATPSGSEPADESKQALPVEETELEKRMKAVESEARYVVEGTSIVAPVKGKYINDIAVGEKIMVLLPNKDAVSQKILSVMNAVDGDGRISPIKGRVKDKIPMEKSGYIVYALVAKGVLAKLIEEENVKIRMESTETENGESIADSKLMYVLAALMFLVIIAGFLLFIFL